MKLMVALPTPFWQDRIDEESFVKLLHRTQCAHMLLCGGTTGEGGMLSLAEKVRLVRLAKEVLPQKQVWAGVDGCTHVAEKQTKALCRAGADGVLVSPPSFFKCTEEGFLLHVRRICQCTTAKVMLYNAPSRCGYTLWQEVLQQVACDRVWLKDAGSDLAYAQQAAKTLPLFCGNEELLQQFVQAGAQGVVSVVANVAPKLTLAACSQQPSPLFCRLAQLAFCRLNPVPVKYMLFKLGVFASCQMRLPLTEADNAMRASFDILVQNFGHLLA